MVYEKGKIESIEWYRGYQIVIEHNLNIYENINFDEHPIYTICKLGRCVQGTIEQVRNFIDYMFEVYND